MTDSYPVSPEELTYLRLELLNDFPDSAASPFMSTAYIQQVASQPYSASSEPQRRPLQYSLDKMRALLAWRASFGADDLPRMAATIGSSLGVALSNNSLYVRGLCKTGEAVIWCQPTLKPYIINDAAAELQSFACIADAAIATMPPGVTEFVVVVDASSLPAPAPAFLIQLLRSMSAGYPDRLAKLYFSPTSIMMQKILTYAQPLLSSRFLSKLKSFTTHEELNAVLSEVLLDGIGAVPSFLGGPASHPDSFNYATMLAYQHDAVDQFVNDKSSLEISLPFTSRERA